MLSSVFCSKFGVLLQPHNSCRGVRRKPVVYFSVNVLKKGVDQNFAENINDPNILYFPKEFTIYQ